MSIIWQPYGEYLEKSNITRFMDKHGIKDYDDLIKRCNNDIEWFWENALEDLEIKFYQPCYRVLDDSGGIAWTKWFIGGKTNIVLNCLDKHMPNRRNKLAVIWEGDNGEIRKITYRELYDEVNRLSNALISIGIKKGDTVGIYMPMVPEVVVALFACFKIGAIGVPIFSGFGPHALATRLEDSEAKLLFTADGSLRRGKKVELKNDVDLTLQTVSTVKHVIVYKRLFSDIPMKEGRDIYYDDFIKGLPKEKETEILDAEDISLIIYTSGTTGKPKGTVHTHIGCLAQMTKEIGYSFDLQEKDTFFWLTDIGWMMGPWEIIGVTHFGGTLLLFEGAPDYPEPDRLWRLIEEQGITILGLSPTTIRLLMRYGNEWVERVDLSSLRILGSTGEPWDLESYMWFFERAGKGRCPIINISGGTEIVGCFLIPFPITALKPCTLRGPGLGMDIDVFDDEGKPVRGRIGYLVCKKPTPSMTKGFLKDPDRYLATYFSRWPNVWYHGDFASTDEDGFWFLHGRADDTIKVSGRRIGPAEIESALLSHPSVSEAAAIGIPHEIRGEGILAFVVLKPSYNPSDDLKEEIKDQIVKVMGKALKPEVIIFVKALPKTRSGKIVRGLIKKKYLGEDLGDISSVENPEALERIARNIPEL